jgi:hypothetical protein
VGVHRHPKVLQSGGSNRGRDRPARVPKLSVDTLLRHAPSHYIPDPIRAKPFGSCRTITTG